VQTSADTIALGKNRASGSRRLLEDTDEEIPSDVVAAEGLACPRKFRDVGVVLRFAQLHAVRRQPPFELAGDEKCRI